VLSAKANKAKKGNRKGKKMSVLDKVRKFKDTRPKNNSGGSMRGIFHDWKDGSNPIRLVGEFLEVRTHFIAPVAARKDRGLCMQEAFRTKGVQSKEGEEYLPQVINCLDWDIEKETVKKEKTCPICRLYAIAKQGLREGPDAEEKKYFDELSRTAKPRTSLKWNIFDRLDPNVTVVENGSERKQKGLKIATIGMEAWGDIEGIFEQCGYDITDAVDGIDIDVKKEKGTQRAEYSACAAMGGRPPTIKVTPFDAEELEIVAQKHDLKQICGKQTSAEKIIDALHGDLRDLLDLNVDGEAEEEEAAEEAPAPAPRRQAPAAAAAEPEGDEDEDALPSGKSQGQKKTPRN
jgi:hypothetical protein